MRRSHAFLAGAVIGLAVLGGCGGDGDSRTAFCDAASDTESFEAIFADFDPADTASALEAFRKARDTEIELRRDAPDAIRADIDLLVQFLDDLVEGLDDLDTTSTGRPSVYDELSTDFDQVEAASGRIETYVKANCTAGEDA